MPLTASAPAAPGAAISRSPLPRVGAVFGVLGAGLAVAVNVLHPRPPRARLGNHVAFAEMAAQSRIWIPLHVGLVLAFVLIFCCLVVLAVVLARDAGLERAAAALATACAGAAVSLVQSATDLAMAATSRDWARAAAPGKGAALRIQGALEDIDFLLLSVELIVMFGVTSIAYGLLVEASGRFPARLGRIAVASGCGGIAVGVAQALHGRASLLTLIGIPLVTGTLAAWLFAVSCVMWRQGARR